MKKKNEKVQKPSDEQRRLAGEVDAVKDLGTVAKLGSISTVSKQFLNSVL